MKDKNQHIDPFEDLLQKRFKDAELTPPVNAFDAIYEESSKLPFWKTKGFIIGISLGVILLILGISTLPKDPTKEETPNQENPAPLGISDENATLPAIKEEVDHDASTELETVTPENITSNPKKKEHSEPSSRTEVNHSIPLQSTTEENLSDQEGEVNSIPEDQTPTDNPEMKEEAVQQTTSDSDIKTESTENAMDDLFNQLSKEADTSNSLFRTKKEERKHLKGQ